MATPLGGMSSTTATGDVVTGPGCATVLIGNKPASNIGDIVSGAACTGSVVAPVATKVLIGNKPVSSVTSTVTGVNPATGVPVSTTVLSPASPKVIA